MISAARLSARVDELIARRRPRIGIGIRAADTELLNELAAVSDIADIVLIAAPGLEVTSRWQVLAGPEPEKRLAWMLANGEIDGLLRGTLDAAKTINAYMAASGEDDRTCPALVEDAAGRLFFFSAVTNHEGFTREQRLHETKLTAGFMKRLEIEPRVAVYAAARQGTVEELAGEAEPVSRFLAATYAEAEWLVGALRSAGLDAVNMTIELNVAIEKGYDLHVPVSGIVGNQVVRAFMASGGKMLAAPRIGLSKPYEDNSRTEGDLAHHVRWLTAMVNI